MNFKLNNCEREYQKDQRIKREDIHMLLIWAHDELDKTEITEFMLIQCYQLSDYDFAKSKKLAQRLYEYKIITPELFTGLDYEAPRYHLKFFDVHYLFVSPKTCLQGHRIIYLGFKNFDAANFNFMNWVWMMVRVIFTIVLEQGSCPGYIAVSDTFGSSFGHVRKYNFSLMRKLLQFVSEAIPIKVKAVHNINGHRISTYIYTLWKPFMSKEMREMINIHSDTNRIFDTIPRECIPKDLGGTLPYTRDELNACVSRIKEGVYKS